MSNPRPRLEGLFNGSATADPPPTLLQGKPGAPAQPPAEASPAQATTAQASTTPASTVPAASAGSDTGSAPEPTGLFDPVALAERYFAMLQALLDLQRDFGMRLAHQLAELPGRNRFRR